MPKSFLLLVSSQLFFGDRESNIWCVTFLGGQWLEGISPYGNLDASVRTVISGFGGDAQLLGAEGTKKINNQGAGKKIGG